MSLENVSFRTKQAGPMFGIYETRYNGAGVAWLVSFRNGKIIGRGIYNKINKRKRFNFQKFGGKRKALAAAKAWRDCELRKRAKWPECNHGRRYDEGVTLITDIKHRLNGRTYKYHYYRASLRDYERGRRYTKCFSVAKYGKSQAIRMAIAARLEMEKKAYGVVFSTANAFLLKLNQGGPSVALKKRKVDKKNINDVQGGGLQVRFVRGGYEYSEYFAYSKFGGKRKTLEAARIRRDEMILEAEGG